MVAKELENTTMLQLLTGDCLQIMPLLPDGDAGMVVKDFAAA